MSDQQIEGNKTQQIPSITAWTVSVASITMTFICIFLVIATTSELRGVIAYEQMEHALSKSDQSQIEKALNKALSEPKLLRLISAENLIARENNSYMYEQFTRNLTDIISKLKSGNFQEAYAQFDSTIAPFDGAIRADMKFAVGQGNIIQTVQEDFKSFLLQLSSLERNRAELKTLENRRETFASALVLIAKDLADLLSLAPPSDVTEDLASAFYTGGVLAHLPKLDKLRDNIDDLVALKNELIFLGGKVEIEGADAPTQFAKRIEELQKSGTELLENCRKLSVEKSVVTAAIGVMEQGVSGKAKTIENIMHDILLAITRPRLYPVTLPLAHSIYDVNS